ncbi:MAG TPA: TIM-barrel domain-containing protein, partial [Verrucomicrobiae bacterium]|nr:TIM-barrel domain-containing protein [Verrucomicrobiae bacterium]
SVIATPAKTNFTQSESAQAYLLTGPHFKIAIDKQSAAVSFLDLHDKLLLRESPAGRQIIPATQPGNSGNAAAQTYDRPPDDASYGLGQHQQGAWNYRGAPDADGANLQLAQANTNVAIPVITSSKGYMLLWDNPAVTNVSVNSAANAGKNLIRWSSESAKAIDYYFCFNDGSPASALKAYRRLTGEAPLMPKWLLGFWQCKERYASQDELLSVAKRFRDMHVPIDGIIQDWQYWPPGNNTWGSHQFDPARYPDPVAMFKTLHDEHLHALISVWAKFDVGSANSKELNDNGGMFPEITRYVSPPGEGQWYDPFADKGRELYWKQINRELFAKGVDGWWLDAPEPEINAMAFRTYDTPLGHGYQVYNAYPLMHSTGIYQGQRAATDDKRVVILTRSAYAGQQRNSAITWSGDIRGNWQVFKNQIPAGLNFSLSGIPYWNTDTGGFFGDRSAGNGDPANPAYQELFSRWFQFSAFCPMFRVHGSYGLKPGKEIWRFDDNTQALMRKYLDLRYRLLPYLYSVAWDITHNGQTFMRPLAFDFPSDPAALDIGNEYLFGPAILVTPVTTRGAAKQSVYLPNTPGPWTNFWTGAPAPSGQSIDTDAPIDTLPLYIRPGSILPLGPLLQYSSEKPADPIELRIYPGADGSFTLYEDQGDSYRYEKGAYATLPFTWNDATKPLTIGNRTGQFPGMLQSRTFNVTLVHQNHGHALAESLPDQHLTYTGAQLTVNLTPH